MQDLSPARRSAARRAAGTAPALLAATFLMAGPAAADICDGITPLPGAPVTTLRVASGLTLPVFVASPPGDTSRMIIVEQQGRIRLLKDGVLSIFMDMNSAGTLVRSPLTGAGSEEGLLGFAFHPDYTSNGFFFVYYTNLSGNNVVARYRRTIGNADTGDAATRTEVIAFSHPGQINHNGGMLAFGPAPGDGNLYIGVGDGGGGCDPSDNGQDNQTLLGSLLRINVDTLPYTIPPGNPFTTEPGLDEIWAYGLRNPWRFSFDRETFDLYIGDVGQNQWEEIDFQPAESTGGENYGWDVQEGSPCPNASCIAKPCTQPIPPRVNPIAEYAHPMGGASRSVTGGYVYRGCRLPDLHGRYFYADFVASFIDSFVEVNGVATDPQGWEQTLDPPNFSLTSISSFGEDARGELYILDYGGEVFKVVPVFDAQEVSGRNAQPLATGGLWTWEDLQDTTMYPVQNYRVYRRSSNGPPAFDCVFESTEPSWSGGDPLNPVAGEVLSYLVTAVDAGGAETSPGTGRDGEPRVLSPFACP